MVVTLRKKAELTSTVGGEVGWYGASEQSHLKVIMSCWYGASEQSHLKVIISCCYGASEQ